MYPTVKGQVHNFW